MLRRLVVPGALVALTAAVGVAAFLLLIRDDPSAVAEATYDGSELTLELPDGASITVPVGAAQPGSQVSIVAVDPGSLPPPPAYVTEVISAWDIDVAGGITAPVTLRFPVPQMDDLGLLLHYHDGTWNAVEIELDNGELVAVVDRLSIFSWVGSKLADAAEWALDKAAIVLSHLNTIEGGPSCDTPDASVTLDHSLGHDLVAGCAEQVSADRTDLLAKNRRSFFLDVYSASPGMQDLVWKGALPIPSCCGGVNIPGGQLSAWPGHFDSPNVEIKARLSVHSLGATVAFLALSVLPGFGEFADPILVGIAYDTIVTTPELQNAFVLFVEKKFRAGLEELGRTLVNPRIIADVSYKIAKRGLKEEPKLLGKKVFNATADFLNVGLSVLDWYEVMRVLTDVAEAALDRGGWPQGSVGFSRPETVSKPEPPRRAEPPRRTVYLQRRPSAPTATPVATTTPTTAVTRATPVTEREALVALYNALDGPNWTDSTNWLSEHPVGEWYGVTVESTGVTELALSGVAGEVPPELGDLTNLGYLRITGEGTGEIPREIGNLTNLTWLTLIGQFTGDIPREIGNLTNLRIVRLYGEFGAIPLEIGNLINLSVLELINFGQFTGGIPPEFGNLTNLKRLAVGGAGASEIPREIGNLTNLTGLSLAGQFTGEIPREVGNLTNLTELHVQGNFTGEIPREVGNLTNLTHLSLHGQFTGEIPREILNLTNLTSLALYGDFRGCVPSTLQDGRRVVVQNVHTVGRLPICD